MQVFVTVNKRYVTMKHEKITITPLENVLIGKPSDTVKDVKATFNKLPFSHNISVNYVYVVDDKKKLVGVASIRDVLLAKTDVTLESLMEKELVVDERNASKTKVVNSALRHNLKAIPLVSNTGQLVGIVNSDQILRYAYDIQHTKTMKLAGILPHTNTTHTSEEISVWKAFIHRIGWIVIGLFGGIYGAKLVGSFEQVLEANIILAAFIPLIVYISDAVGTQTQTLYIRDIALNPKIKILPYMLKQTLITTMIAVICGLMTWGVVHVVWQDTYRGAIIGIATATSVMTSTFIAILIPYLLVLGKQDPADGGGPFATIIQDLSSIFVYFTIATLLI